VHAFTDGSERNEKEERRKKRRNDMEKRIELEKRGRNPGDVRQLSDLFRRAV